MLKVKATEWRCAGEMPGHGGVAPIGFGALDQTLATIDGVHLKARGVIGAIDWLRG